MNQNGTLTELLNDADDAIEEARHSQINGAINWGDLSCRRTSRAVYNDGSEELQVWIEEAAPDAHELYLFVGKRLAEWGWPNVNVITDW